MINTSYKKAASPAVVKRVLNEALVKAMSTYNPDELPECGYGFSFAKCTTFEEELLEIYTALVRSGVHPLEARQKAPKDLEHIYEMRADYQEFR